MLLSKRNIKKLIEIVQNSTINELEIISFGRKIRITRFRHISSSIQQLVTQVATKIDKEEDTIKSKETTQAITQKPYSITSPMAGILYLAPSPQAEPYVKIGDIIHIGQVICIIEAMKLMNEIASEVEGKIVEILVKNGNPVEFGQPLFLIEHS